MESYQNTATLRREDTLGSSPASELYTPAQLAAIKAGGLALKAEFTEKPQMVDVWVTIG